MADASLEALLEVQAHDLVTDQLRRRRQGLAERRSLLALAETAARVDEQLAVVGARAHELERSQRRLEDEVDILTTKRSDSERRLYDGTVGAPRELQALAREVEALARRTRALEDELLELMEASEPLAADQSSLEGARLELDAEASRLAGVVSEAEAEIDGLLAAEAASRAQAEGAIPPELLATYEQLRRRLDGVGVARLDGGRCTGCHLALPAMELDAVRRSPVGAMVRHEECGRILVA